ncbi:exonuclease SbcCD subunit D [Gracilibacillus oryzae]|uniref:Nuclease SbcCD subunit D n=1 Tax=Gracilibacillus oryzae TaxID=1672701 RepID=A0A7C8GUV2_9BACI|nr:exonuclease SbcCD subunit D [Gracilibacillus oryzae]
MKILHTADWHLGKLVHGIHMTEDQTKVLDQIMELIIRKEPDVLIIAGDLYDRSVPPREAVELLNQVFTRICTEIGIPVLAISGNHDSPDRLGFGASLFRSRQLYLHTSLEQAFIPVTLEDKDGPINFHLIPYFEPAQVREYFQEEEIQTHHQAMEKVIDTIRDSMDPDERHIIVAHTFAAGGMESDSEERLTMIGGSPYVDASLFIDFDYTALGHLHRPQKIMKDTIRYSGSIMKYSFSEANHQKSVTMVNMNASGSCEIDQIPLTPDRDMKSVKGYFQEIMEEKVISRTEDYLQVELLDDGQILDPVSKLRTLFPNILRLERKQYLLGLSIKDREKIQKKQEMNHEQLFQAFYKQIKQEELPDDRSNYIHEVITSLMKEEREK